MQNRLSSQQTVYHKGSCTCLLPSTFSFWEFKSALRQGHFQAAGCVPMPATLLPLALLVLSAAALVLKVACHHVYMQVQAPARRASSPGGPRLPSIFQDGKPEASNSFPSSQQGTGAGSHTAVFWNLTQPSSPVPPLSQRNKAAAPGLGKKPVRVQGPGGRDGRRGGWSGQRSSTCEWKRYGSAAPRCCAETQRKESASGGSGRKAGQRWAKNRSAPTRLAGVRGRSHNLTPKPKPRTALPCRRRDPQLQTRAPHRPARGRSPASLGPPGRAPAFARQKRRA